MIDHQSQVEDKGFHVAFQNHDGSRKFDDHE